MLFNRETNSVKYLLTYTFGDLYLKLNEFGMGNGELATLLKRIEDKGLIKLENKVKESRLNLNRFSIVVDNKAKEIKIDDDKTIYVDGKKYNSEEFIRLFVEDDNKNNRYVLVVPKITLEDGKEIILSKHLEYLELVKKINNLDSIEEEKIESKSNKLICYICNKEKNNVTSEYTKKFDRTGINKIFTTTTLNYSQNFKKYKDEPNNYYICNECYQNWDLEKK